MNNYLKNAVTTSIVSTIAAIVLTGTVSANIQPSSSIKLLTANFDSRKVVQVEVGDFHFKPGQIAPIHTHSAPAIGYVVKGEIIYQVEGEKQQLLREGDAFYEPINKRILRFDNASATEEAIFVDFNLEQKDEPFIVFEKPPTEAIDRRTLPTVSLSSKRITQAKIYSNELQAGKVMKLDTNEPTLGLVATGVVVLKIEGKATQRIAAGSSFSVPADNLKATIVNASSEVNAKIITFHID